MMLELTVKCRLCTMSKKIASTQANDRVFLLACTKIVISFFKDSGKFYFWEVLNRVTRLLLA